MTMTTMMTTTAMTITMTMIIMAIMMTIDGGGWQGAVSSPHRDPAESGAML